MINSCPNCGGNELSKKNGFIVCEYCNSKLYKSNIRSDTYIELKSDVDILLQKCKDNPKKAKKYANLILDIDPTNKDARKYL